MIGDVEGQDALIVDDEIASGGTMLAAVGFLKSQGVRRVDAAAVHPVMSGAAKSKLDTSMIGRIIVTNSIPIPPERLSAKIEVVSIAKLFADAIRAIHDGASVSELFR
jgi:ribose-phosphate pyrophosphokinase